MSELLIQQIKDYTSLTDEVTYQLQQLTDLVTKINKFTNGVLGNRAHRFF